MIRESYFKAKSQREKCDILDEYCRNTGQSRKYVIRKINKADLSPNRGRKGRRSMMDKLKLPWPRYGRCLTILVGRDLSPFWRQK